MKKILISFLILSFCMALKLAYNPTAPTGYTSAPALNSTTSSNCRSCHSSYALNVAGDSLSVTGLPTSYIAGKAYAFSIKFNHATADRKIWGFAIKAIDTVAHAVVGTWSTTNTNTSVKGTAGGTSYELSHASAASSTTAATTYTYSNMTWTAPAVPTTNQKNIRFYICAVSGNKDGGTSGDYVCTKVITASQAVAPTAPLVVITQPTCTLATGTISISAPNSTYTYSKDSIIFATTSSWSGLAIGTYKIFAKSSAGLISPATTVTLVSATLPPPTPSSISSRTGLYNACINDTITYRAVVPAPTSAQKAASVYRWIKPANTSIMSASTDSMYVKLKFLTGYTGGNLSVKGQTNCAIQGTVKVQSLTHTGCPSGTKLSNSLTSTIDAGNFNVNVYPNPTNTVFTVQITGATNEYVSVKIMDAQGRVIKSYNDSQDKSFAIGNNFKPGIYLVEVAQGNTMKTIRVVKY